MGKEERSRDEAREVNRSQREVFLGHLGFRVLLLCAQAGLLKHPRAQGSAEH